MMIDEKKQSANKENEKVNTLFQYIFKHHETLRKEGDFK